MASNKKLYIGIALAGLLILSDCSVEKNTRSTRFYHSLTGRYNIYFNALESFRAGIDKISRSYTDDYGELLKVFEYSDPSTASIASSDMEQAIQKASKLITLKSITAKPELSAKGEISEKEREFLEQKEFNKWVDDSYLLIGKARFYKHEFTEATEIFNYILPSANDPAIKTESVIWLARINNEKGNYSESQRLLNEIDPAALSSRSLKAMFNTTSTDLLIKQKRFSEAADALERSLKFISGKVSKYRLTYLLAQLYELSGQSPKATEKYGEVIKMNPPYDVEFGARIKIAGVFDINSGNPEEIKRELEKMLKDSKNKDFHDQIFFALGNLAMKEGNVSEALEFYRQSAASISTNQNQKGRAFLALADYYYDKSDFMKAGAYYDSSVTFLDQKNPAYPLLKEKSQNLNALNSELKVIQTEDSLQKVARMPERERSILISSIIENISKAESEGKVSEYSDQFRIGQYYENEQRFQNNIQQEGKWYFYNQAAMTFGRTEFRRRWGDRKLEDNWRRVNKARSTIQASNAEETGQGRMDTAKVITDYKQPAFYLKNLPLTDSLIAISNDKISTAFLNAGKAYSERIGDNKRASSTYETLISRFPESELVPEALYNLYNINKEENGTLAETYRQRLLLKYPESEYARILSDPEYYAKKMANLKMTELLYEKAYSAYSEEKFEDAIKLSDEALSQFGNDILAPKFLLLKAYSIARTKDEREFKENLANIIKQWPSSEESRKAKEIIAYLNQAIPELQIEEDKAISDELFVADTASANIFILIISDKAFNINQATFDVISYNIDNYPNKNYRTEGSLLDNKYIIIKVSGFQNYRQASDYFRSFETETIIRNPSASKMTTCLISEQNLKTLNSDKNPERYLLFFNNNFQGAMRLGQ